jgi:DNA-binding response OmpR family regulator
MTLNLLPVSTFPVAPLGNSQPQPKAELAITSPDLPQLTTSRPPRLLVIEPTKNTRDVLQMALERVGYTVFAASNGAQGLQVFDQQQPIDLVLVEATMSGVDGYRVCAELRRYTYVPLVLLSDLNQMDQVAYAFSLGVDDYITKPFYFPILEARLQAILRRATMLPPSLIQQVIAIDDIVLNAELREVSVRNQPVNLSPIEYGLLSYLMHMVDRPVSKQELFKNVWGYQDSADVSLVRVGVHRLREKIEKNPTQPCHVLTVPGYGYKFQQLHHHN